MRRHRSVALRISGTKCNEQRKTAGFEPAFGACEKAQERCTADFWHKVNEHFGFVFGILMFGEFKIKESEDHV